MANSNPEPNAGTAAATIAAARRLIAGDGCSSSPELWYHDCCTEHDRAYTTNADAAGQPITRAQADAALWHCMRRSGRLGPIGRLFLPAIYWSAVRLFGRRHCQSDQQKTNPLSEPAD